GKRLADAPDGLCAVDDRRPLADEYPGGPLRAADRLPVQVLGQDGDPVVEIPELLRAGLQGADDRLVDLGTLEELPQVAGEEVLPVGQQPGRNVSCVDLAVVGGI